MNHEDHTVPLVTLTAMYEVDQLRKDVQGLQSEMSKINGHVSTLQNNMADVQKDVIRHSQQLSHQTAQEYLTDRQVVGGNEISTDAAAEQYEFYRHCMATALQKNSVDIIEYVPYKSEIPDILIAQNNFNSSEDEVITNCKQDSKAMMRRLLLKLRHRSLEAMIDFVETILDHNKNLYKSIQSTFESLKETERAGYNRTQCTAHLIVEGMSPSDVVDHLDQERLLSKKLHVKMVNPNAEHVDDKQLWNQVFLWLTEKDVELAMKVMLTAIVKKGPFFEYIAQSLRKDIKLGQNAFQCRCRMSSMKVTESVKRDYDSTSTSSDESPKSSSSETPIVTDVVKRRRRSVSKLACVTSGVVDITCKETRPCTYPRRKNRAKKRGIEGTLAFERLKVACKRKIKATKKPPGMMKQNYKSGNEWVFDEKVRVDNARRALAQWRKLKIITFFLTKMFVKLSKHI